MKKEGWKAFFSVKKKIKMDLKMTLQNPNCRSAVSHDLRPIILQDLSTELTTTLPFPQRLKKSAVILNDPEIHRCPNR